MSQCEYVYCEYAVSYCVSWSVSVLAIELEFVNVHVHSCDKYLAHTIGNFLLQPTITGRRFFVGAFRPSILTGVATLRNKQSSLRLLNGTKQDSGLTL